MTALQSAPPASSKLQPSAKERTADEAAALFEEVLQKTQSAMGAVVTRVFGGDNIDKIRDVLPTALKDQAERFVKRAALYFNRKKDLEECTAASKLQCILDAAEMGLALDGRLCHAVAYNVKYKDERGAERWRKEAQCQPDYKGLLVVARRSGSIVDAYGDVICANDTVKHGRKGAKSHFTATFPIGDRGEVIGVYAIIVFDGGRWRYEIMNKAEVEAIRARSKAKGSGPWQTDYNEMAKKTVLRRALKLYCNDPGTIRAMELDEREFDDDGEWIAPASNARVRRSALNDAPPTAPGRSDPAPQQTAPQQSADDPPGRATDETPGPGADTDGAVGSVGREPGDDGPIDDPEPGEDIPPGGDDRPLSEAALALEAKLNDPTIDRKVNADCLQQILAGQFTPAEKEHLKGIAKRNTDRLKGKK